MLYGQKPSGVWDLMNKWAGAFVFVLAIFAAIMPAANHAFAGSIMVTKAFARASPTPNAAAGAAYISLMNHGEADRLTGARSSAAKTVEIHKSEVVNGVMKMIPVAPLDIPMHGALEMKPGGYHLMLLGLTGPLKKDTVIEIILIFEKSGEVTVQVPVGAVAAKADSHDHGSGEDSGG
jgi:copper(I)-binding protein